MEGGSVTRALKLLFQFGDACIHPFLKVCQGFRNGTVQGYHG